MRRSRNSQKLKNSYIESRKKYENHVIAKNITKIKKILEFQGRILKATKILESNAGITKLMKIIKK